MMLSHTHTRVEADQLYLTTSANHRIGSLTIVPSRRAEMAAVKRKRPPAALAGGPRPVVTRRNATRGLCAALPAVLDGHGIRQPAGLPVGNGYA